MYVLTECICLCFWHSWVHGRHIHISGRIIGPVGHFLERTAVSWNVVFRSHSNAGVLKSEWKTKQEIPKWRKDGGKGRFLSTVGHFMQRRTQKLQAATTGIFKLALVRALKCSPDRPSQSSAAFPPIQRSSPARLSLSSTLGMSFSLKSQSRLSVLSSACCPRRALRTWMIRHTSGATLYRSPKIFSTSWIEVCSTILWCTNRAKCIWSSPLNYSLGKGTYLHYEDVTVN